MSLGTIRTALAAKVQAVTGIVGVAPVYDYWRHVTSEKEINDLLKGGSQGRLHFWCVSPAQSDPLTIDNMGGCDQADPWRFDIRGYYALLDADASEKAFLTIVEAVIEAFRLDKNLGGTVISNWPVQWPENVHVMLAGVLCHHARISVPVRAMLP